MIVLFLFDAGIQKLINAFHINIEADIARSKKFIQLYQDDNSVTLIRAVLGKTELVILKPDEEIILSNGYAKVKGALA